MELRRELLATMVALMALNLALAFGSIGLFTRMGPAIEYILRENVRSLEAAEEILAELAASAGGTVSELGRERIRAALLRAQTNITEAEERPMLDDVQRLLPAALDGDSEARRTVVDRLSRLATINRDAMGVAGHRARRLGAAGAWTAVGVGFTSFLVTLLILVRLRRRFLQPLGDLHDVLEALRRGDRLRRCRKLDGPLELARVTQSVNALLDERLTDPRQTGEQAELEGLALVELLDRQPGPAALIDRGGRLVRTSKSMLEALTGPRGQALKAELAQEGPSGDVTRIPVRDRGYVVVVPGD